MVNKIKIYKNFKILRKHQNAMILIGNFDGLHLGHQRLFKEAIKYNRNYHLGKNMLVSQINLAGKFFNLW